MPLFGRKRTTPTATLPATTTASSGPFHRTPEPSYAAPRTSGAFGHSTTTAAPAAIGVVSTSPTRHHGSNNTATSSGGLFSRRRSSASSFSSVEGATAVNGITTRKHGLFGNKRKQRKAAAAAPVAAAAASHHDHSATTTAPVAAQRSSRGRGLFGRRGGGRGRHSDPAIEAARSHVMHAERAEYEAQAKVNEARNAAGAARREVKMLERQAVEEARLAKVKKHESKSLSRRLH